MLTGRDTLKAEQKYKPLFSFENYAKIFVSANRLPEVGDESAAFFDRILIVNFPNRFEGENADPDILEKVVEPRELSGLLNAALEGLAELKRSGFWGSRLASEIREEYIRKSDPIAAFVMDRIEHEAAKAVPNEELYDAFVEYCRNNRLPVVDASVFGRKFPVHITGATRTMITLQKGRRVKGWLGIRLAKREEGEKTLTPVEEIATDATDSPYLSYIAKTLKIEKELEKPVASVTPPSGGIQQRLLSF